MGNFTRRQDSGELPSTLGCAAIYSGCFVLGDCPQLLHSSPTVVVQIQNCFPKKLTRLSVAGVPHRGHLASQSINTMTSTVHAGMNGMMLSQPCTAPTMRAS